MVSGQFKKYSLYPSATIMKNEGIQIYGELNVNQIIKFSKEIRQIATMKLE